MKYKNIILLIVSVVVALLLFKYHGHYLDLLAANYPWPISFVAGIMMAYAFTAAPATALLLVIGENDGLVVSGLLASLGAVVGDLIVFRFVQTTFLDELNYLTRWRVYFKIRLPWPFKFSADIKKYLLLFFASLIIASPFPDEIGVAMVAATREVSLKKFAVLAYFLNATGIFTILLVGKNLL